MLTFISLLSLGVAGLLAEPSGLAAGDDWTTAGYDCTVFAAGDVDQDGFADIVTVNGGGALCVARSVRGWKAAPWEVLRQSVPGGAEEIAIADVTPEAAGNEILIRWPHQTLLFVRSGPITFQPGVTYSGAWPAKREVEGSVTPPPYEGSATRLSSSAADIDGDGQDDRVEVFSATRPHEHRMVRVAVSLRNGEDADGDGLLNDDEVARGSNPQDRDSDDDGLLDGWEVHGLPRDVAPFDGQLSPTRRDVLLLVSRYEQLDEATALREVEKSKRLYAAIPTKNIDGSTGITIHTRWTAPIPLAEQGSWWSVGNRVIAPRERGLVHWMQVTPGGGGQAQQTGDMGGAGAHWAAFGHELGHQLSLSHEGDSKPAWCPLYPSLMNYAFNYALGGDPNAIRFSDGRFASVELRESALVERLPFPLDEVRYLAAHPFRFTLEAESPTSTRIDWNHNGVFDDGVVEADINYGGSTHCGIRRNVDLSSAAPALMLVDGVAHLCTVDPRCTAISVRACTGDGTWTTPREIPSSPTRHDPVAVGVGDHGFVFFRTQRSWHVARVTKDAIEKPIELPSISASDLSAVAVEGRVLLITRQDSNALATQWFDWHAAEKLTPAQPLTLTSRVAPGGAREPSSGNIVLATSAQSPRGHDWCLRVTWLTVEGDQLREGESRWTRGESAVNHCTTRPVVVFRPTAAGDELNIFHTGWFGESGLTTAWRTRRVGNKQLDDGWLTCLLYDEWTLTRVGVAFVAGPQGAVYSYRWDPGDHGDMRVNMIQTAHNGWGIDADPMRDFDDCAKITQWGIRHSILLMQPDPPAP